MNIAQLFLDAANKHPNKKAIVEKNNSITFAQLQIEVGKTAAYFQEKGIKTGDRVLVAIPMSIDLYRVVLALFYIGATAVFIDEWVNKKRLETCCQLAECTGFIAGFKVRVLGLFSKEIRKIPIHLNPNKQSNNTTQLVNVSSDASALITFTTGSTGIPKAANKTHQFLKHQFEALTDVINPNENEVDMPTLPIVLFLNLGLGITSVLSNYNPKKPESIHIPSLIDTIKTNNVSRITSSPFLIKKLSEYIIENDIKNLPIEKIITGGAPVFPMEAKLFTKALPNVKTTIVYGSTEAEPISVIDATVLSQENPQFNHGLLVGKPYKHIIVKIIPISPNPIPPCTLNELKTVGDGQIGEIIVSGNHVLDQYYKNPKAFKKNKIEIDGTIWHRTGDSGLILNYQLYLTGRCKQLINYQDKLLSPFIIENQLQQIEGVTAGTLLQINTELILVIESIATINENEIPESIPYDSIKYLSKIPRDPRHHSKIDYERLRHLLF
ncbi:MAG: AMP-binding protein [Flavobacteriales bacterium]|nr:AMP-binding protein [Flavobacteriales bacterium]